MKYTELSIDTLWLLIDTCNGNPVLKGNAEAELRNRMPPPLKYSREYVYSVCIVGKRVLTIYFKPGSDSLLRLGRKITISVLLNEEEERELQQNYSAKPPIRTHGFLKGTSLVESSPELRLKIVTEGFETSDILFCEFE